MQAKQIQWTEEIVLEWLDIAVKVDKSLPPVYRRGISGQQWDIKREWYELLWDIEEVRQAEEIFRPTNRQISIWEEVVLRWFPLIEDSKNKRILWLRSCGVSWVKIGKKTHLTRQTVAHRYQHTVEELVHKLRFLDTKIS